MNQSPRDSYPPPRYAWYVVIVLFLAYVVSFLDRQILSLLIEPIKQDLQLTDTMISLLQGFAFAIFYTIVGIPIGRLADSKNRKGIIMIGVSFWSLMTSLCGFAQNAVMLFLARMGVGVGEASLSPSAYSIISDYFPRGQRGKAASYYSLGIFTGAGLAFMFGGLISQAASDAIVNNAELLGRFRPWQLTFVLTGMLGIPVVLLMLTVKEPSRKEKLHTGEGGIPLSEVIAYLWKEKRVYGAIMIGTGFISVASYGLFAWAPAFFIRVYEYTPRSMGLTFGSIILTLGTLSLLLGGWFADKRFLAGRAAAHLDITIVVTALAIIPALFLLASTTEAAALTSIAFIVLFLAVHTGLIPAALQLVTPNELRGQVIALYLFILNLIGLGFGPTAVALITDRYFEDTMQVGKSLAITQVIALAIGVLLILSGRNAYLAKQQRSGNRSS